MGLEDFLGDGFISTRIKDLLAWGRKNSLWPMPFGTACCAIEMMSTLSSRYDMSRFGAEVVRFSPRQSDMLIVGGRVTLKMMPVLQRIWLQMPEPKWSISMGACGAEADRACFVEFGRQCHPLRSKRRHCRAGCYGGRRQDCGHRQGRRSGHPGRRPAAHLRAVLPCGPRTPARQWWDRPGAEHLSGPGDITRGANLRGKPGGTRDRRPG